MNIHPWVLRVEKQSRRSLGFDGIPVYNRSPIVRQYRRSNIASSPANEGFRAELLYSFRQSSPIRSPIVPQSRTDDICHITLILKLDEKNPRSCPQSSPITPPVSVIGPVHPYGSPRVHLAKTLSPAGREGGVCRSAQIAMPAAATIQTTAGCARQNFPMQRRG